MNGTLGECLLIGCATFPEATVTADLDHRFGRHLMSLQDWSKGSPEAAAAYSQVHCAIPVTIVIIGESHGAVVDPPHESAKRQAVGASPSAGWSKQPTGASLAHSGERRD